MLNNKLISISIVFLGLSLFFSFLAAHCEKSNDGNYHTDDDIQNSKASVLSSTIAF